MESYNKVEICGTVGNVRIQKVMNTTVARFSVATNYCFRNKEGEACIETTWHSVTAWENQSIPVCLLDALEKGMTVCVSGRLRNNRYTDASGIERMIVEILADSVRRA